MPWTKKLPARKPDQNPKSDRLLGEAHLIIFGSMFILVVLFLPGGLISAGEVVGRFRRRSRRRAGVKVKPTT